MEYTDASFISAWGEFTPVLTDVKVFFYMPLFMDHGATGVSLTEEEERTL